MSAKIQPFDSIKVRKQSSERFDNFAVEADYSATKSPRSPRTKGKLSRQSSFDETKPISRQNSFQNSRRKLIIDTDDEVDITDHSSSSARGMSSSRGQSAKNKSSARKHSVRSGKKRVSFRTPIIDPRPEPSVDLSGTFGNETSLTDEDFQKLQESGEDSYSVTPRRMKNKRRRSGSWRRQIPFGQYIPTLPSLRTIRAIFSFW